MATTREVTLGTIAHGAADELFASALADVLANIENPNCDARARRVIALTFSFRPDEERRLSDVAITVATKLAGVRGIKTLVFHGRHEGELVAVEQPSQDELFPTPIGRPRPVEQPATADGGGQ